MPAYVRNGMRAGLIFGLVVVVLILTGFTETAAGLLSDLFKEAENPDVNALILFVGLLALWAGTVAARPSGHSDPWAGALINGLVAGVLMAAVVGIFTIIAAGQIDAGVNLRRYLIALSPQHVHLLTLNREAIPGTLTLSGIIAAAALLGAALARGLGRGRIRRLVTDGWIAANKAVNSVPAVARFRKSSASNLVQYALILLVVLWLPTRLNQAWDYNMGTIAIYVLLGLGLNIVVGLAGLLDLGYVAFFAVGAYTVALLTAPGPHGLLWNFWVVLPLGVLLAATAGVMLGVPVLRLRGDYLAIVTLGFGEIIRILAGSDALTWFSGGPMGVRAIPQPRLFGTTLGPEEFVYLLIIGVVLVIFVTSRLRNSRVGRAWVAMREDETVAQAVGINTLRYKLLAFGIGAAFAGLGGALFASRNQFTNPQDHTLIVSINVLAVVIVGGMGSIPGVILGAFVLKGIPEILREFEDYRIILFGALLVTMMIVRPEGIWPSSRRRMELEMHAVEEGPPEELPSESSASGDARA